MAETDVIIPISVETEQATSSLGELSKAVSSAKKELKSAEQGSKEYDDAMKKLAVATDQLTRAEARQKDDLAKVSAAFKEAKQAADQQAAGFKNTADAASQTASTLGQTAQAQAKNTEAMKNAETQSASFRARLKEMKDEMTQMILDGVKPTDKAFVDLATKAGELKDAIQDANGTITLFASDTKNIDQAIRLTQSLTSVMGVVASASALFGTETEKVTIAMQKAAAATSAIIGLQEILNNVRKQGTIENTLHAKANDLLTAANTRLATALGISTVAAKALMAALTLGLSIAITAAIAIWNEFKSAQAKSREEAQKFKDAVADIGGPSIATFQKMAAEWNNLGDSLQDKQKYVKANKGEFEKLGVSIKSVSDAEKIFENGGTAFLAALKLRAQGLAANQVAMELYAEAFRNELKRTALIAEADELYEENSEGFLNRVFGIGIGNDKRQEALQLQTQINEGTEQANDLVEKGAGFMADYEAEIKKIGLTLNSNTSSTNAATEAQNKYNEALKLQQEINNDAELLGNDQFEQRRILAKRQYEEQKATLEANNLSIENATRIHQANLAQIKADQDADNSEKRLNEANAEITALEDQLRRRIEVERMNNEQVLWEEQNLSLAKLNIWQTLLLDETLIGEERIQAEQMVADAELEVVEATNARIISAEKARADAEEKIDQRKVKSKQATLSAINALIELGQAAAGEGTEAAKALGYAGAIVNTAAGAAAVLGDPTLPLFAKIAGMITVLAAGGAQITAIANTKVPDYGQKSSSTSGSAPSTAVPIPIAQLTAPIVETHSNMTAAEVDEINQAQRVYVVESDIRDVVRRVEVNETESFF